MPLTSIEAYAAIKALMAKVSNQLIEYDKDLKQSSVEKIKTSLTTMEEIIKKIDGSQPTSAVNPYFELIKDFSDLRYYSLMIPGFKPVCTETEFNEIRHALAPELKSTLAGVPKEIIGIESHNIKDKYGKDTDVVESTGIGSYLGIFDRVNLSKVNTKLHKFYEDDSANIALQVTQLLEHGLRAELDEVKKILEKNPKLMFIKGRGKDYSGREFIDTTLIQALGWAWDIDMLEEIMLDCINKSQYLDDEDKKSMRAQLKAQCDTSGVTYILHGQTIIEPHYSFNPLIQKHKDYVTFLKRHPNWSEWMKLWSVDIGGLQRLVPACVAMALLNNDGTLDKPPSFKKKLTRSLEFNNYTCKEGEEKSLWFMDHGSKKLGSDFAIIYGSATSRGWGASVSLGMAGPLGPAENYCLSVLIALCRVKTADLAKLKGLLDESVQKPRSDKDCSMM